MFEPCLQNKEIQSLHPASDLIIDIENLTMH